jgi:RecB family endonuclease NucS
MQCTTRFVEMTGLIRLRQQEHKWMFSSEADLETFIWNHLKSLLHLTPFKRQYAVQGMFCDILALTPQQQLVIIELKNVEDRYLIPQLTRYYHALSKEQPMIEQVDYTQPIQLIGITPSFHPDNVTDCLYSQLNVQLLQFKIEQASCQKYLSLLDQDGTQVSQLEIPDDINAPDINEQKVIKDPPRALWKFLSQCTELEIQGLLHMRRKILGFDHRIKEDVKASGVAYSRGQKRPLAEIKWDEQRQKLFPYLYLPFYKPRGRNMTAIVRTKIWTDGQQVTDIGYLSKSGKKLITHQEWISGQFTLNGEAINLWRGWSGCLRWNGADDHRLEDPKMRQDLLEKSLTLNFYLHGLAMPMKHYHYVLEKYCADEQAKSYTSLTSLVDLALRTFSTRT